MVLYFNENTTKRWRRRRQTSERTTIYDMTERETESCEKEEIYKSDT
jgi:hypothetical protein